MNSAEKKQLQLRVAPFILAIVCFVLPFLQISCQGDKKGLSLTGVQLVTGFSLPQQEFDTDTGRLATRSKQASSEPLMVLVLISAAVATALCFQNNARGKLLPALIGALGVGLMIAAKIHFDKEVLRQGEGMLQIDYLAGFVLTGLGLAAGAGISAYQYSQLKRTAEGVPPPPALPEEPQSPTAPTAVPPPPPPQTTLPPATASAPTMARTPTMTTTPAITTAPVQPAAQPVSQPAPQPAIVAVPREKEPVRLYFADEKAQPHGPFSFEELLVLERASTLTARTHVIEEGAPKWERWAEIKARYSGR